MHVYLYLLTTLLRGAHNGSGTCRGVAAFYVGTSGAILCARRSTTIWDFDPKTGTTRLQVRWHHFCVYTSTVWLKSAEDIVHTQPGKQIRESRVKCSSKEKSRAGRSKRRSLSLAFIGAAAAKGSPSSEMNIKCRAGKQKLSRLAFQACPDYKPDEPLTLVPFLSLPALTNGGRERAEKEDVCGDLYLCEQTMNENERVRFPTTPVEASLKKLVRTPHRTAGKGLRRV